MTRSWLSWILWPWGQDPAVTVLTAWSIAFHTAITKFMYKIRQTAWKILKDFVIYVNHPAIKFNNCIHISICNILLYYKGNDYRIIHMSQKNVWEFSCSHDIFCIWICLWPPGYLFTWVQKEIARIIISDYYHNMYVFCALACIFLRILKHQINTFYL